MMEPPANYMRTTRFGLARVRYDGRIASIELRGVVVARAAGASHEAAVARALARLR